MNTLPASIKNIAFFLERLPGIGGKTANRLAFYFLRLPQEDLEAFADSIRHLKDKTKRCTICNNLTEDTICSVCSDPKRDQTTITVVEDVLDLLSFENGNIYHGVYHVLHGRIDPLNRIGPDDIFIQHLVDRSAKNLDVIKEIVLATNPNMEGEATAMYIRNKLNELKTQKGASFTISRLGYGLPIGASLEYADYMTLSKAIENRNGY